MKEFGVCGNKKQPENIFPIPSAMPAQQLSSGSAALQTNIQISVLLKKKSEIMDNDGNKNYLKPVSLIELPFQYMSWRLTYTEIYNELHI